MGYFSLANNRGNDNTAIGFRTLLLNTTANGNIAIGRQALELNTTGCQNTASGTWALLNNTTGDSDTAIGFHAGMWVGYLSNTISIGYQAKVYQSNEIRLGNNAITLFSCNVGLSVTSDRNLKENFLPVDGAEVLEKIKAIPMTSWNYIGHDAKKERHYGPMAQDFHEAFGTDAMGTIGSPTTVNTNDMAGVIFSALQQLAKENETLKAQHAKENEALKARQNDLELQLQQLHEKLEKLNPRLEGLIE